MRFRGLDLNLLVALDVLLRLCNVSLAADKLHLSQSATSGALGRLRLYFEDELLVPSGRKMTLTPRARELVPAVQNALMLVDRTILQRPDFSPQEAERTIRFIASDYMMIAGLAEPLHIIQKQAPNILFAQQSPRGEPSTPLEQGNVEFLAMPSIYLSHDHPSHELFTDDHVVVAWEDNDAVRDGIDMDTFLALRHVTVIFDRMPSYEAWILQHFGNHRIMDVVVDSFATVPFLIVGTKRIAVMHKRAASIYQKMMPLRILPPPCPIPPLTVSLQWHRNNEDDPCEGWVRGRIIQHFQNQQV